MLELSEKLLALGLTKIPDSANAMTDVEVTEWIEENHVDIQSSFFQFIESFGSKAFNKDIVIAGLFHIPKSDDRGQLNISFLFGLEQSALGIPHIQKLTNENLPKSYIPFAMGDPTGDYWVYEVLSGQISFWVHDAPQKNVYSVAENIHVFVNLMKESKNKRPEGQITDYWISDDL